jgi:hypothetical protein
LGFCFSPLDESTFVHPGECPTCLGAFFPFASYKEAPWFTPYDPKTVKTLYLDVAQVLLRFSVTWLVGGYDKVCEAVKPPLFSAPVPAFERFPGSIHEEVIRAFYEHTACLECGRASFLESDLCSQCPGKTHATVHPMLLFMEDITRDVYRRNYLPRIQAGEFQPALASVRAIHDIPFQLPPDIAGQLNHKTGLVEQRCMAVQDKFDCIIEEFIVDMTSGNVEPVTEGDRTYQQLRDDYGAFSLRVLQIISHILAHDSGLNPRVGEHVLRYLAPMLLHRLDARRPARWEQYRVDDTVLNFGSYQTVAEAYMELPGHDTVRAFNTVVQGLYQQLRLRLTVNKTAMDSLQMTKEKLLTARVSFYSEVLPEPPTAEPSTAESSTAEPPAKWDCPICYGFFGDADVVKLHRCNHVAHRECIVRGLIDAPSQLCFYCRQPFGGPEEVPGDLAINDYQDKPWLCYGL